MWVGPTTGESATFWLTVLAELRNRDAWRWFQPPDSCAQYCLTAPDADSPARARFLSCGRVLALPQPTGAAFGAGASLVITPQILICPRQRDPSRGLIYFLAWFFEFGQRREMSWRT